MARNYSELLIYNNKYYLLFASRTLYPTFPSFPRKYKAFFSSVEADPNTASAYICLVGNGAELDQVDIINAISK
jgi:hypothetical protein